MPGRRRGVAARWTGLPRLGTVRQPRDPAGQLEDPLGVQAAREGRLGAVRPGRRSRRAPRSRGHASGEGPRTRGPVGPVRGRQQRGPAEPFAVRGSRGDHARAVPRGCRLPAAHLQAAVHAAGRVAGQAEILNRADPKPRTPETKDGTLMTLKADRMLVVVRLLARGHGRLRGRRRDDVVGAGAAPLLLEIPVRGEGRAADLHADERQRQSRRSGARGDAGRQLRGAPRSRRLRAHVRALRPRGHGGDPGPHGQDIQRPHRGRQHGQRADQRLRRSAGRVRHQHPGQAADPEHPRHAALRARVLPRPPGRPGVPARRVRQRSTAQHRPEPVVRAGRRAHRLATRRLGAGAAHHARVPAVAVGLRRQQRLRRRDPGDRTHVPDRGAPDPRLRAEPLGVARRHLGHRRPGHHRRPRRVKAGQPRARLHARLPHQRQPPGHVRLPVDGQRPR